MQNFSRVFVSMGFIVFVATRVVSAQGEQQLPEVAKAMEKIVQKKNAIGGFTYDSHRVITIKENERVPGLNGLMFVKYKNGAGEQINMSIQWFEDKEDLLGFYVSNLDQRRKQGIKPDRKKVGEHVVWATNIQGGWLYDWTDAEHFALSLGGQKVPEELLKAYLKQIPGRSEEADEKDEKVDKE